MPLRHGQELNFKIASMNEVVVKTPAVSDGGVVPPETEQDFEFELSRSSSAKLAPTRAGVVQSRHRSDVGHVDEADRG